MCHRVPQNQNLPLRVHLALYLKLSRPVHLARYLELILKADLALYLKLSRQAHLARYLGQSHSVYLDLQQSHLVYLVRYLRQKRRRPPGINRPRARLCIILYPIRLLQQPPRLQSLPLLCF